MTDALHERIRRVRNFDLGDKVRVIGEGPYQHEVGTVVGRLPKGVWMVAMDFFSEHKTLDFSTFELERHYE